MEILNRNRKSALIAGAAMLAMGMPGAAFAQQRNFDLPAQSGTRSIPEFARQAGIQIVAPGSKLRKIRTRGLKGALDVRAALNALLQGTGLRVVADDGKTITLAASAPTAPRRSAAQASGASAGSVEAAASPSLGEDDGSASEEIVVTAQKRDERLLDVPVPVTALNTETLIRRGEVSVQDYYARVPGLNLTIGAGVQDAPVLSIRGVTTGGSGFGSNPTVSVVVDDQPYGSTSSLGGGNLVPDLDPSDLARVEVLRGPQGTLYGASSLGGLLKFVTVAPSTDAFSARFQGGLSGVKNGDTVGYNTRAAFNVPLSESIAVRASAFYRSDPGFIDDPALGIEGVNRGKAYGGRLAALFRLSSDVSLRLSAVLQKSDTDGQNAIHDLPGLQDLQQSFVLPGLGGYTRTSQIYSAILTADIGAGTLTSITGYSFNKVRGSLDRTAGLGPFMTDPAVAGVSGAAFTERFATRKFSQEVRLDTSLTDSLNVLIGGFYTDESSDFIQDIEAVDTTTFQTVAIPYHNPFSSRFTEYAGFADLTIKLSDRFDVQLGGRISHNRQSLSTSYEGALMPLFALVPSGTTLPVQNSAATAFTYLITPRFKITPDVMVYARLASGYRPGGPNANAGLLGIPTSFGADRTQNYELGAKGSIANGVLTFDLSIYHIDWSDIQLQVSDPRPPAFVYFDNGGKAHSQGAELALDLRPWRGGVINTTAAWNSAELDDNLLTGSSVGNSGDRLPFSARFSGSGSIEQTFEISEGLRASAGATISYVGKRLGTFTATPVREIYPSYTQIDLRAGLQFDRWTLDVFAKNVGDKRGILGGGLGTAQPFAYKIIQPRTIGISLAARF
jgi:outer membrane receptor protein involved in Fe transport